MLSTAQQPALSGDLLETFFSQVRPYFTEISYDLAGALARLFDNLRTLQSGPEANTHPPLALLPTDNVALSDLFNNLRAPMISVEAAGLFGNPWTAAMLRRDEVRIASILSWFLDPNGGHGCGASLLMYILGRAASALRDGFPVAPSTGCIVSTEVCPDGDRENRVDIQVDDTRFFLVIEVKIDAPEQPRQLERYCEIAASRAARARHWAVIFLTIDGRAPVTVTNHAASIVPLAWKDLASALRHASQTASQTPRFLASSFATFISKL